VFPRLPKGSYVGSLNSHLEINCNVYFYRQSRLKYIYVLKCLVKSKHLYHTSARGWVPANDVGLSIEIPQLDNNQLLSCVHL
jgi:hypothetical protein